MDWISHNKEWFFSGIGVTFIGMVGFFVKRFLDKAKNKPSQSITSGNDSNNIQGGKDVNVTIGDKNVRK